MARDVVAEKLVCNLMEDMDVPVPMRFLVARLSLGNFPESRTNKAVQHILQYRWVRLDDHMDLVFNHINRSIDLTTHEMLEVKAVEVAMRGGVRDPHIREVLAATAAWLKTPEPVNPVNPVLDDTFDI